MKTTLFVPVRNEIEGVKAIMPRVNREWVDEILVIDGHSTDGTREYFEEQGYQVIQQRSSGICGAYWECFEAAAGDIIIPFSPDNNSIPELIPALIDKMYEGYDLVIASRYLDGAKSYDDDLVTAFGNWMFTKLVNLLFEGHYTDVLVLFRAFKKDMMYTIGLDEKKWPVLEIQMAIQCLKHNLRVTEIPADEPKRIGGVRKMKPLYNGSTILYVILKELFRR